MNPKVGCSLFCLFFIVVRLNYKEMQKSGINGVDEKLQVSGLFKNA